MLNSENGQFNFEPRCYSDSGCEIPYTLVTCKNMGSEPIVFPRSGDVILNLSPGDSYNNKDKNQRWPHSTFHCYYFTGLFSKPFLKIKHIGERRWITLKIHPVIGYYILKTPMKTLLNKQSNITYFMDYHSCLTTIGVKDKNQLVDNIIDLFFYHHLSQSPPYLLDPIYHAVNYIKDKKGQISVTKLARKYYMSTRTLNRNFLMKVGLPVKSYAKIWQLDHAVKLIRKNASYSLEEIAFLCGYYDVSHLVKDFNDKVGQAPSVFRPNL